MPSEYTSFEVLIDNDDGTVTMLGGETISVYDVTNDAPLDDVESDAAGVVAGATVDVDAGTLLRFSFSRADGVCGCAEILTT